MEKIVVIGANSYIARNFITVLQNNQQYEIILYGKEESQIDGVMPYTQVDVLDIHSLEKLDLRCSYIFFFVGMTGPGRAFKEYDSFIDVNEKALLNVLTIYMKKGSTAKFVFPSSRLVYKGKCTAIKEEDEKDFKSIYAINKNACEQYLKLYHEIYGIPYIIFRICVPYGTLTAGKVSYGTAGFMLSNARCGQDISLYGNGEMRRTLTYIEDICIAMIKGAEDERCVNDSYNIGGEDYSLREMAELIASKYDVCVKYVPWPELDFKLESGSTVFDSVKLDEMISYKTMTFVEWLE